MKHKLHKTGQFMLEHNVEYRIVNRFKLCDLLKEQYNITISAKATENLDHIQAEARRKGVTQDQLEVLCKAAGREIFTENRLGQMLLKGFRHFIKDSVVNGQVQAGRLNRLAAYGLQIPGLTGSFGLTRNIRNLVTDAGRAGVASRINGAGGEAAFTYIALGTGVAAAANGDTTLGTELATSGLSRANSTATRVTTTVTNDTAQLVNTFTVTGTAAVTESGVLNAASVGTLLCRQTFSAINVVNGDSLQVTWKVKAA